MPPIVDSILAALSECAGFPADGARGMPGSFYTSDAFLEIEKNQIFRKEWICLGAAAEIPQPGDYFTAEIADEPLLVVRGEDGVIRTLSNVCRHRGSPVAEGCGNRKRFSCPYHAWTYAVDGQLLAAPCMEQNSQFDKARLGLPSFSTEIWQNFIFVSLDGSATPLAPRLAALEPTIRNYHHENRNLLFTSEDAWHTNWKCLTENFMEGYHIAATHPTTLNPMTPTALCEKLPGNGAFTAYKSHYAPSWPERGPFHPDLTETERRCSVLFCVFPSFVVAYASNFSLFLCLHPRAVDSVAVRWGVAGELDDPQAKAVQDYIKLCHAFNGEDRLRLETLQRGLRSRHYIPGPLAPADYEGTIRDFYRFMASRLAEGFVHDHA